jgi:hypothetical protein
MADVKKDPSRKPPTLTVVPAGIPALLRGRAKWLGWRWEWRDGAWTKPPINLRTGGNGSSTNKKTWCTFEQAVAVYQNEGRGFALDGIGYALEVSDGIVGMDWDHVFDPLTGEILCDTAEPDARAMETYIELSPTGGAYRGFALADLPPSERRAGNFEIYNCGRYLTCTGHKLTWAPETIEIRQEQVDAYHAHVFKDRLARKQEKKRGRPRAGEPLNLSDTQLMDVARNARNGGAFSALFDSGSLAAYGDDHSAADLALCNYLAFYAGGDEMRIDSLFRQSALMREKWDRPDYRTWTIERAVAGRSDFYHPPGSKPLPQSPRTSAPMPSRPAEDLVDDFDPAMLEGDMMGDPTAEQTPLDPRFIDGLPYIETNRREYRVISDEMLSALVEANDPPVIFVRAGKLSRVQTVEEKGNTFAQIQNLNASMLRDRLSRVANFVSTSEKRGAVPVAPPSGQVEDLLFRPQWPGISLLNGIVTAPIVGYDGSITTHPGYHANARLYYFASTPLDITDTTPTKERVSEAVALLLDDMLADFPFVDRASRAHALAYILLPFVRLLINGPTPLHIIDAPKSGTGKTLLALVCSALFVPGGAPVKTCPQTEEEWAKVLTTFLIEGDSHILLDNARYLNYETLFGALTSPAWKDRVLGFSESVRIPIKLVWAATSNNLAGNDELNRRSIMIRMDAQVETPSERDGFHHPDIMGWIAQERPRLVSAALTIIRAWIDAGRPSYSGENGTIGSFENWIAVIGGILETAGVDGFLGNREEQKKQIDSEGDVWVGFITGWYERFNTSRATTGQLIDLARPFLSDKIEAKSERGEVIRLGKLLQKYNNRIFSGMKICSDGRDSGGFQCYRLRNSAITEMSEKSDILPGLYGDVSDNELNNNDNTKTELINKTADIPRIAAANLSDISDISVRRTEVF